MALGPNAWLSLALALLNLLESKRPPRPQPGPGPTPGPSPGPGPGPPPEPTPGPGPAPLPFPVHACYRIEWGGRVYQWTRPELEQKVKGTGLDDPGLWAAVDALKVGDSISRMGGSIKRIECDVLDIEPLPDAPEPPPPQPGSAPLWPLPGISPEGKPTSQGRFKAPRAQGTKFHAGVDLGAPEGTPVVAPEDGTLVRDQGWDGVNAKALLLETARADGPVLFFGAVAPGSWPTDANGKLEKRAVKRGEQIARVGRYPGGSEMLHFEMYTRGTRNNRKWFQMRPKPPNLIDPTEYVKGMVQV